MFECKIISSEEVLILNHLQRVTLPTVGGEIGILSGHAEIFVVLSPGEIVFLREDGDIRRRMITDGGCHVKDNKMVIII